MLARLTLLVVATLYIQASSAQQNGSNSISNGSNSNGNIIQRTINQISNSRILPINLQQTLNQQGNLQTSMNLPQSPNTQNVNSLQAILQKANIQPFSSVQQTEQSLMLQQQQKALQQNALHNVNNLQTNIQQQNSNLGNMQQLQQQRPGVSSTPLLQNGHISRPQLYQEIPTNQAQLSQVNSAINSEVNAVVNSGYNPGIYSLSDTVLHPQNQPVAGVPSYVINRSQMGEVQVSEVPGFTQPSVVATIGVQQNGQQTLELGQAPFINVQNPSELSNPITIIKSVQPQSSILNITPNQPSINDIQAAMVSSPIPQSLQQSYSSMIPSSIASSFLRHGSKSSKLKALLPLIINLIKERNSCSCPHNCSCGNKPRNHNGDNFNGYSKQNKYEVRPEELRREDYEDNENYNKIDSRRNSKKHSKRKHYDDFFEEYDQDYKDEFEE